MDLIATGSRWLHTTKRAPTRRGDSLDNNDELPPPTPAVSRAPPLVAATRDFRRPTPRDRRALRSANTPRFPLIRASRRSPSQTMRSPPFPRAPATQVRFVIAVKMRTKLTARRLSLADRRSPIVARRYTRIAAFAGFAVARKSCLRCVSLWRPRSARTTA